MQNTVIQYNYFSANKITSVFTLFDALIIHSTGIVARIRYGSCCTLQPNHITSTPSSQKIRIDGAAITPQENCSSDERGLRLVLF
jgi:hypothetical protein